MLYTVGEMAKVMHIPASTLRYYVFRKGLRMVEGYRMS